MKVLIADRLDEKAIAQLRDLGASVTVNPELSADTLPDHITDHEILIVRSTKVIKATIERGMSLSVIIRAGAGVNTIDLNTANERGIYVANCPGKNNDAVAELAIGLMIAADRRIAGATIDLRNGSWQKKEYGKARGLKGRTLGIVGLGAIGKGVARRAQGMEMRVIAYSVDLSEQQAKELDVGYCTSLSQLASEADVISIHVPYLPETKGLINGDFLGKMKNGAILVNTSRGEIMNTADLKRAIQEKKLRVGLDVFENEPSGDVGGFTDTELASMITCTPHIGASTDQSTEAIADEVIRIVRAYQETGKPLNSVNQRAKPEAHFSLVIRHFNRVGVLAYVLDDLKAEGINIEEMENSIFQGGKTAACSLKIDRHPSSQLLEHIAKNPNVIHSSIRER